MLRAIPFALPDSPAKASHNKELLQESSQDVTDVTLVVANALCDLASTTTCGSLALKKPADTFGGGLGVKQEPTGHENSAVASAYPEILPLKDNLESDSFLEVPPEEVTHCHFGPKSQHLPTCPPAKKKQSLRLDTVAGRQNAFM